MKFTVGRDYVQKIIHAFEMDNAPLTIFTISKIKFR